MGAGGGVECWERDLRLERERCRGGRVDPRELFQRGMLLRECLEGQNEGGGSVATGTFAQRATLLP